MYGLDDFDITMYQALLDSMAKLDGRIESGLEFITFYIGHGATMAYMDGWGEGFKAAMHRITGQKYEPVQVDADPYLSGTSLEWTVETLGVKDPAVVMDTARAIVKAAYNQGIYYGISSGTGNPLYAQGWDAFIFGRPDPVTWITDVFLHPGK